LNIGIYQGRLSNSKLLQKFPLNWRGEFLNARQLGYHHIEIFLERKINLKNPFWFKKNSLIKEIKKMKNKKTLICDNFLIFNSLTKSRSMSYISKVIYQASKYPKSKLIIPLNKDLLKREELLINKLIFILSFAKKNNVEISFECNFDTNKIITLSKKIKNGFKITFDTGNVFLIEKNIIKSFRKLNSIINHIHLKDRNKFKKNVTLGTGLINFKSFFRLINVLNYKSDITLETNRGDDALLTAFANLNFLKKIS
tara:strand:+ start:465 stop:1229 length:765 start_codon:yes stop_codon:yes gene_type:complete